MTEPLTITAQPTPNPNAAKFTLNRQVASQGKTYRRGAEPQGGAEAAPAWALQLLQIAGVTQVFAVNNFISITKEADAQWDEIRAPVERVLNEAFAEGG
jgi:hypothetical protein